MLLHVRKSLFSITSSALVYFFFSHLGALSALHVQQKEKSLGFFIVASQIGDSQSPSHLHKEVKAFRQWKKSFIRRKILLFKGAVAEMAQTARRRRTCIGVARM